jgi:hypothetical protein
LGGGGWLDLIVQAAADGVIDFSKAKLLETRWWTRLALILQQMQVQQQREQLRDMMGHLSSCLSNSHLIFSGAKKMVETEQELFADLMETYNSSSRRERQNRRRDAAKAAVDAWTNQFGDPNDPHIAAEIDAAAAGLLATATTNKVL